MEGSFLCGFFLIQRCTNDQGEGNKDRIGISEGCIHRCSQAKSKHKDQQRY